MFICAIIFFVLLIGGLVLKKYLCLMLCISFVITGCSTNTTNSSKIKEKLNEVNNEQIEEYPFIDDIVTFSEVMKQQGSDYLFKKNDYGIEFAVKEIGEDYLLIRYKDRPLGKLILYNKKNKSIYDFYDEESYQSLALSTSPIKDIHYSPSSPDTLKYSIGNDKHVFMCPAYFPHQLEFNIKTKKVKKIKYSINSTSCLYTLGFNHNSEVYIKDTLINNNKCSIYFELLNKELEPHTENTFPIIEYVYSDEEKYISIFFRQANYDEKSNLSNLSKLDGINNFKITDIKTKDNYGTKVTFKVEPGYNLFGEVVTEMYSSPDDHISFWTEKEKSA